MTSPQITHIADFLRISYERANQIPYDLLLAIEAARVRQEQAVQTAFDAGFREAGGTMVVDQS